MLPHDPTPNFDDALRHEPAEPAAIHVYDPNANSFGLLYAVYPEIALYVYERGNGGLGCAQILVDTEFHLDARRDIRIKGMDGAVRAAAALAARRSTSPDVPTSRNRIRPPLRLTEPPPEPQPPREPWQ
jgi:hypothetical protein